MKLCPNYYFDHKYDSISNRQYQNINYYVNDNNNNNNIVTVSPIINIY